MPPNSSLKGSMQQRSSVAVAIHRNFLGVEHNVRLKAVSSIRATIQAE